MNIICIMRSSLVKSRFRIQCKSCTYRPHFADKVTIYIHNWTTNT